MPTRTAPATVPSPGRGSEVEGGTYTLVISLPRPIDVEVGALGEHRFDAGGYAYTGGAVGPGGFGRLDRHRRVAAGEHDVRHWHVDHLMAHPATAVVAAGRTPGRDVECAVADALGNDLADGPVPGFGASDCSCPSHLAFRETVDEMERVVRGRHEEYSRFDEDAQGP